MSLYFFFMTELNVVITSVWVTVTFDVTAQQSFRCGFLFLLNLQSDILPLAEKPQLRNDFAVFLFRLEITHVCISWAAELGLTNGDGGKRVIVVLSCIHSQKGSAQQS